MNDANNPNKAILESNSKFKDCHKGQRCFIIGTGPSIEKQNLKLLENEICFGVSTLFKHRDYRWFKPQYYCVAPFHQPINEDSWQAYLKQIEKKTKGVTMFFGISDIERNFRNNLFEKHTVHFLDLSTSWDNVLSEGIDITRQIPCAQTGTLIPLMVAIFMGFKEIYLLGCDQTHILRFVSNYKTHFFKDGWETFAKNWTGYTEKYEDSLEYEYLCCFMTYRQFGLAKRLADSRSIKIFNSTERGLLDVFPRMKFESVVSREIIELHEQRKKDLPKILNELQKATDLLFKGNPEQSLEIVTNIIEMKYDIPDLYFLQSLCYEALKKYDLAFDAATMEIEQNPNHKEAKKRIGILKKLL